MSNLPSGTVTFLMTDIENSSEHWESAPTEMREFLGVHDSIVSDAVLSHRGSVVKHLGDGIWAAFVSAPEAAQAAIDIQLRLQESPPEVKSRLAVRIGLHTGDVEPTGEDYFGPVPNRTARITDLANGNQMVCSSATAGLLSGFQLRNEGRHQLRGIGNDEVFMLTAESLEVDTRPFRRPIRPTSLPRVHTSFLGRDDDVSLATKLLAEDHTVVTMLGPGGVGKTRLSVEIGYEVSKSTSRTVVFCDLTVIAEADQVAAAVADAIGARQQRDMDLLRSIADYVSSRNILLILDNCEHVVEGVRSLVVALGDADDVDILATSRAALGLDGEQIFSVQPLPAATDGVELFVSRAKQHDPTFELNASNQDAVRQIATRLDGIPLAIELAAAKATLMTPSELVAGLENRFRLLGGADRRHRHETLRDIVQWSYQLLSQEEATVYTRMSVFAGGATLAAIGEVCSDDDIVAESDIPDLILALVEKSMIVSQTSGSHRRFRLLETLREFGEEELIESGKYDELRRKHADYFRQLAVSENERIYTAAEPDAWRVLDLEWANLRAALDTYEHQSDVDKGGELVISLVWYAVVALRFELFTWAEELLEADGIENHALYTDLCGAAALGAYFTVTGRETEWAETGLEANPADPQGFCRLALAAVSLNNVHTAEASDKLTADFLETASTIGSRLWAEGFRTFHQVLHGPREDAPRHANATARIARESGSTTARALSAWAQGMSLALTDIDSAIDMWTEALDWPRAMPRRHVAEQQLIGLILNFRVGRQDLVDALQSCLDAVKQALDNHYYSTVSHLFGVTAIALCRAGEAKTGARLVGAMIGNGHLPRENAVRALAAELGESVEAHQMSGMSMSIAEAGQVALKALEAAIDRERANHG